MKQEVQNLQGNLHMNNKEVQSLTMTMEFTMNRSKLLVHQKLYTQMEIVQIIQMCISRLHHLRLIMIIQVEIIFRCIKVPSHRKSSYLTQLVQGVNLKVITDIVYSYFNSRCVALNDDPFTNKSARDTWPTCVP